jgi:hypothetical protein
VSDPMLDAARAIVRGPSFNRTKTAGYDVKAGERVLLVEKRTDDPAVTELLVRAMRELGAAVDIFHLDIEDRPMDYLDEYRALIHNVTGIERDRALDLWLRRVKWVEDAAQAQGYSLLIQGESGALPKLDGVRYEGAPWYHRVTFPAAGYPWPLWDLINQKAWEPIWQKGMNGTVHLTDPEGTDVTFGLRPEHWTAELYARTNSRRRFEEKYYLAHLYGWPTPPYEPVPPANGIVAGTFNHYSRPFPHCRARLEDGKIVSVEGGGEYGDKWQELLELTKDIKYPEFPGPGMFWWWECAIGTHPKMVRPHGDFSLSTHASMFERLRSGYLHMGFGTANGNPSEAWAEERGLPWGHVHLHLQFATYVLTTRDGEEITIIRDGRLTALDDPEVIEVASRYGNPDELLKEAWVPPVPGVSVPGSYEDYAPDPGAWLERYRPEA